jgi:hypothetical protein
MDLLNWRLKVDELGRQTWHYLETESERLAWPQTFIDRYWLQLGEVAIFDFFITRIQPSYINQQILWRPQVRVNLLTS